VKFKIRRRNFYQFPDDGCTIIKGNALCRGQNIDGIAKFDVID